MKSLSYFSQVHEDLISISDNFNYPNKKENIILRKKILKLMFKSHYFLSNTEKTITEQLIFFQYLDCFIQDLKKEFL